MKKVVLITGANGMLAKHLSKNLESEYSVRFLTRNVTQKNEYLWNLKNKYIDPKALIGVHFIIHLAGSSIANKKWSQNRKRAIKNSRIDSAKLILDTLKKQQITINTFISASAIGFYGSTTSHSVFTEESLQGNDFLSDVCQKWENAAHLFKSNQIAQSVSIVRIGIILAKNDGALKKIITPIKYGVGAAIGKGNQYMPWIHIDDLSAVFKYILDNKSIRGIFNAVSPEYITNIEFTKDVANKLKRKIILPNIPSFIIQVLFGEMSVILLKGNRISSEKIKQSGFTFKFKTLQSALNDLIN